MTHALNQTDGLHPADLKVLSDIREYGWHIAEIFASEGEAGPEWAFSIGLFHSFLHPEVIIFGLPLKTCTSVIDQIGQQVKAGKRFDGGGEFADFLEDPHRCTFRPVRRQHYSDYVGFALWFYETDPFPLLQCFWSDEKGKFPWDDDCGERVRQAQPLLFK